MSGTHADDAAVLTESCSFARENKGETRDSVQYQQGRNSAENSAAAAKSSHELDRLAAARPWLESPRAVAAELGITTAECLARARGNPAAHHFTLALVHHEGAVWIYRPHRRARMERDVSLRSAAP